VQSKKEGGDFETEREQKDETKGFCVIILSFFPAMTVELSLCLSLPFVLYDYTQCNSNLYTKPSIKYKPDAATCRLSQPSTANKSVEQTHQHI
jgi:hypothetical protein